MVDEPNSIAFLQQNHNAAQHSPSVAGRMLRIGEAGPVGSRAARQGASLPYAPASTSAIVSTSVWTPTGLAR